MNLAEARGYVLHALRQTGWNQVVNLFSAVGLEKAKAEGQDTGRSFGDGRQFLTSGEQTLILEVIWGFIIQGILIPGLNDANQGWPFLRLTEYGRRCIEEDRILPHDPDGYLREFVKVVPNADSVVVDYLTEALQCYVHGLYRAAAVMLGGASEKAVLNLIDSCGDSIHNTSARERFKSDVEKAQSIFRKYHVFDKRFSVTKSRVPKLLTENLSSQLAGVFDLIRASRNDAGHPASGVSANLDTVYSHLRLFLPYCDRIYGLIDWFSKNKT